LYISTIICVILRAPYGLSTLPIQQQNAFYKFLRFFKICRKCFGLFYGFFDHQGKGFGVAGKAPMSAS